MPDCIFCKIAKKEIPSSIIYEDDEILVFLDAFPASIGQSLVMPKKHSSYIFDIKEKEYSNLFLKAKKIAKAIDSALSPIRTCIVVEGFLVEHVHIRLHPCYGKHLNLKPIEPKPSQQELKETTSKIKKFLR